MSLSKLNLFILTGFSLIIFSSCSSSPMRTRLDKNFVYNCALELIEKGVSASDAERLCISSHKGEMVESDRTERLRKAAQEKQGQAEPSRAPAEAEK